jgi:hypothetical protein
MKALKLTSLFSALSLLCGCGYDKETENENDDLLLGIPAPYSYHVFISFQDASGNDLVKGIAHDWNQSGFVSASNPNPDGGFVNPDLYTLDVVFPDHIQAVVEYQTRLTNEKIAKGLYIPDDPDNMLDSYFVDHMIVYKLGDYYCLKLICFTPPNDIKHNKLLPTDKATFKLRFPYVFGDDAEHEIVTHWSYPSEKVHNTFCTSVEFENKKYISQSSPITIVLDRH